MANVCVYDAVAIAAGVLLNHRMWAANYIHVSCLTEENVKKLIFSCGLLFIRCLNYALQYMHSQRQMEGVGPSKTPV